MLIEIRVDGKLQASMVAEPGPSGIRYHYIDTRRAEILLDDGLIDGMPNDFRDMLMKILQDVGMRLAARRGGQ